MPPVVTDSLATAVSQSVIGLARWGGQPHIIVTGGFLAGGTGTGKTRAFHLDGTHTDLPDRPQVSLSAGDFGGNTPNLAGGTVTMANGDMVIIGCQAGTASHRLIAASQTWTTFTAPPAGPTDAYYQPFLLSNGDILLVVGDGYPSNPPRCFRWSALGNSWSTVTFPIATYAGVSSENVAAVTCCTLSDGSILAVALNDDNESHEFAWSRFTEGGGWNAYQVFHTGVPDATYNQDVSLLVSVGSKKALLCNRAGYNAGLGVDVPIRPFVYNGDADAWHSVPSPAQYREGYAGCGSCAGEAYLIGGVDEVSGTTLIAQIEKFNAGTETWSNFDTLPVAVRVPGAALFCLDSTTRFYVAGGTTDAAETTPSTQVVAYTASSACGCDQPPGIGEALAPTEAPSELGVDILCGPMVGPSAPSAGSPSVLQTAPAPNPTANQNESTLGVDIAVIAGSN